MSASVVVIKGHPRVRIAIPKFLLRHALRYGICTAAIALIIVLVRPMPTFAGSTDVLSSRYNNERTGADLHETLLNPDNVKWHCNASVYDRWGQQLLPVVNPYDQGCASQFGLLYSYDVDDGSPPIGDIYAQPLYVSHQQIPGKGLFNILLVATTNNYVFALDADGPKQGSDGVLWKRVLGTPPSIANVFYPCSYGTPCIDKGTNIRGNVGVMSTPVIDRARGIIFVVSRVYKPGAMGGPARGPASIDYELHALDLGTGRDRQGSPELIRGSALGVDFVGWFHNQRVGLALDRGQIIIAFGSHGDVLVYHGWIFSYRYSEQGGFLQTGVFVTTPDGDTKPDCSSLGLVHGPVSPEHWNKLANQCAHGGIWMSGRAPAVDSDGNVLVMVGNGRNDMSETATRNFGNSLIRLEPVNLNVVDFFTPDNHIYLNATDLDFGGSGPMIIPGSNWVMGGGKQGVMYVWHLDNLGRFATGDPQVVQKFDTGDPEEWLDTGNDNPSEIATFPLNLIKSTHPGHIMGGPVYWPRPESAGGSRIYNWSENSQLRAYVVDPLSTPPVQVPPLKLGVYIQPGHPGGILTLSAHGADSKSGIVWASTFDASNQSAANAPQLLCPTCHSVYDPSAINAVVHGTLRAYDADTLEEIWDSDKSRPDDNLGDLAKFTPPTVANGHVYVGTFSGYLRVYGLLHHRYVRPAAIIVPTVLRGLAGTAK
jgi:hypothetical protein